ncbi:MAG TPA: hypothetical protein VF125_05675 [Solirubrobacterales bacterium]
MNKKLMLLATGVLTALAFAALPAVASAGEPVAHCQNGAASCIGAVTGGATQLRDDGGQGITCSSVHGKATVTNGSATGFLELTFTECKETITGFKFSCTNTGVAGKITTGSMVTHLIYLHHLPNTTTGLKVTLPGHGTGTGGVTFTCAGFSRKTVTGSVIGHISNPECNTYQTSHTADFTETSLGSGIQKYMQTTTTGEKTDLISNNDAGGTYTTAAQIGSGVIHWEGTKVNITC